MKNKKISTDLYLALCNLQGLELLLLVGQKKTHNKSRVDLLAGCKNGDICKYATPIETLLKTRWPAGELHVCDDSVRFDLPLCTGGVAVYNSTVLVDQIMGWLKGKNLGGQHRPWAIGYWLPEIFLGDLATAESLYDAKNIHDKIKRLVIPYPPSLSGSISDLCVEEITQKLQMLERYFGDNSPIELELCLSDITASMIRLAFARSCLYFHGFKFLDKQAQLLRSSDLPIYELALKLSKKERVRSQMLKLRKFL